MGDMENNPYKIAQVIFFWLNIVSLSNTRDVGQFFLIGDQKVQDDRGEQFLFPQRWTKVSAKIFLHFKILTFPFHFAYKLVICNEKFLFSWFIITLLQG